LLHRQFWNCICSQLLEKEEERKRGEIKLSDFCPTFQYIIGRRIPF